MATSKEHGISTNELLQIAYRELSQSMALLHESHDRDSVISDANTVSSSQDALGGGGDTSSILTTSDDSSVTYEDTTVALTLQNLKITDIPIELIDMAKDKVSKLSLTSNLISDVPLQFRSMVNLTYLEMSHNQISEFPRALCHCPSLEILDLSFNRLWSMPRSIGGLESLKVLALSNNEFQYVPPCVANITDLQFLEMEHNPLVLPSNQVKFEDPVSIDKLKLFLNENSKHIWSLIDSIPITGGHGSQLGMPFSFNSSTSTSASETAVNSPVIPVSEPALSSSSTSTVSSGAVVTLPSPLKLPLSSSSNGQSARIDSINNITTPSKGSIDSSSIQSSINTPTSFITQNSRADTINTSITTPVDFESPLLSTVSDGPTYLERLRSNSESHTSMTRAAKRRGFVISKISNREDDEIAAVANTSSLPFHSRGFSYDELAEPLRTQLRQNSAPATNDYYNKGDNTLLQYQHQQHNQPQPPPQQQQQYNSSTDFPRPIKLPSRSRGSSTTSPILDSVPAYFRRLSTLPEELKANTDSKDELTEKIVESSRKVLFSIVEMYNIIARYTSFCDDPSLNYKLKTLLQPSEASYKGLLELLETEEPDHIDSKSLLQKVSSTMKSSHNLIECFRQNLKQLSTCIDIKYLRMLIMITYGAFNELWNAWSLLFPDRQPSQIKSIEGSKSANNLNDDNLVSSDEQLYERVLAAVNAAQVVLSQLTEAVSKQAIAVVKQGNNPVITSRVRDLTNTCVAGVDITRRLKSRMESMKDPRMVDRRKFWEELNTFLKSVINILATTKVAINDLPFLAEARQSLATLTRVTKEIPVLLEYSSYKVMMSETSSSTTFGSSSSGPSQQQLATSTQSTSNIGPLSTGSGHNLTTPLLAILGPAAQAVMSPPINSHGNSPFIPHDQSDKPSQ